MVDGVGFEAVQLEQSVFDGDVADEVEGLHGPHSADSVLFLRQVPWLGPPENTASRETRLTPSLITSCFVTLLTSAMFLISGKIIPPRTFSTRETFQLNALDSTLLHCTALNSAIIYTAALFPAILYTTALYPVLCLVSDSQVT